MTHTYIAPPLDTMRAWAVSTLLSLHGKPYIWGGDDPMAGFDCSGLVIEVLQSVGMIKRGLDYTAAGLQSIFSDRVVDHPKEGCLVFWYDSHGGKIIHVEMCVDKYYVVGASGGGRATDSLQDAINQNAYVKMNPINYRGSNYIIADPFMDS